MSNDTLLQILDELKDVVKNGGMVTINDVGGISTFNIPDYSKGSQANIILQDMINELSNSAKDLDEQYNKIKNKADITKHDSTDDGECTGHVCEDGADDGFDSYDSYNYESGGYDLDKDDEEDVDELINKLADERKELKDKLSHLGNALADLDTITKVGSKQYHLMNMQYNSMVAYCNILSERINFLKYVNGLD